MKIAVVGSGVSGLAATWLLNEHSEHEVHTFESDARPGGHANTCRFTPPEGSPYEAVDVDTGFIVFNPSTYPNFIRFLKSKGIKILPTEMTFSVSRDRGAFEWAGDTLFSVFCQPWRLLDPRMWNLLYDVLRFNACARSLITDPPEGTVSGELSIGEYLDRNRYSDAFKHDYLVPMTAAIWSTPPDKCALDFPARTLIQFMHNHHLLQVTGKPKWLTIAGGSRHYVQKILSTLPKGHLHLSTPVLSLSTSAGSPAKVQLTFKTASGETRTAEYDHVVLACHSDTSLRILEAGAGGASERERKILGRVQWNRNEAVLHSDKELMPKRRIAWSSWNYLTTSGVDEHGTHKPNNDEVALTYWMNELQHLPELKHGPVLVTLNPPFEPALAKTVGRWQYDHPVLDAEALLSQREMPAIQGRRGISYAGAWLKYGFHEDGFTSGLRAVADHIPGVKPPFPIASADRTPENPWIGALFVLFESLHGPAIVAFWGTLWLALLRSVLGCVFDLRQLKAELNGVRAEAAARKSQ